MTALLDRWFGLASNGTTVRTELAAGATTFLTMAYIAFVNPQILSYAGMPFDAVFVATCLSAAFATLLMGLAANYPIALAPGMGLNAFFTYGVVLGMGHAWESALGAVFVSGLLFFLVSILPIRRWIMEAIPRGMKLAISAGIGLFLAIIALQNAGVIQASPATMVTTGALFEPEPILAFLGFSTIVALAGRDVPGAVMIGILGVSAAGILAGISGFTGIAAAPPDPSPTFLALDLAGALQLGMAAVIITFLIVDLFDTTGTLIGVGQQGGLLDSRGMLPRSRTALLADSAGTVGGSLLGTSPVTSYIESATGIAAGGRTGLTAVTVALLFLASLFFAPLAQSIPPYATAPAILYVACLMARSLTGINWHDITESAPAVVTAIAVPLTFSIADGIGIGFVTYVAVKVLSGRWRECPLTLAVVALVFAVKFAWL